VTERFRVEGRCDVCHGRRLRPEALAIRLAGNNNAELSASSVRSVAGEHAAIERELDKRGRAVVERVVREIRARLQFLEAVGVPYLSLDRAAATLSGGEGQRVRLATQIGSALVGVLYVLDEPSIGLHPRDSGRLLATLRGLVERGNTVLVVEHDLDTVRAADYVLDLGPGAGVNGGRVVGAGTPDEVARTPGSVTGPYLSGAKQIALPARRRAARGHVTLRGARLHNLAGVDVAFPVGCLVAVTGVSGSGKSSLVLGTLLPAVRAATLRDPPPVLEVDAIEGLAHFDRVVAVDASPIGRTPRSSPATYTGIFTALRELFATVPEARARGFKPGRFSFNVKGGRCETCQGEGVLRVEMHFLPDVLVPCEACNGKRYERETLEVRYRGYSVADVLEMTVDEAVPHFEAIPKVRDPLLALHNVGLGYVKLGQAATTLSGGEAQRVKLARELARRATGRTLYILDEPTTGLHVSDTETLLALLAQLVDQGNTVVVIEHQMDVVKCADWVIDIGPEGGDGGGRLVAEGTPEEVARVRGSHTGESLAKILGVAPLRTSSGARTAPSGRSAARSARGRG
jgi:excinuclease ABC subunit A